MTALADISVERGAEAARELLDRSPLGAVQIERPLLDELPYRDFVRALLDKQGFKLDFNRLEPDAALVLVSDQLLGPGAFVPERSLLAQDISALVDFACGLVDQSKASVALRTYFAPGDLVWHLDRMNERIAFRLLWPIGRPAGMLVTPADNVDQRRYLAYMRREHPILGRLDTCVLRTGAPVEKLWAHRPRQLEALGSGRFPFIIDPDREWQFSPGAASIHRVQTGVQPGTYHRSSWANRDAPGLQIVITVSAD